MSKNIVTIDGPSGVGKSSVAKSVAIDLGYRYLDTGAMYRSVTLAALRAGIDLKSPEHNSILDLLNDIKLTLDECGVVFLNGESVGQKIREDSVTQNVSAVSAIKEVRDMMVRVQRTFGSEGGLVAEGRDMGSVVFPDARFKFFLEAEPAVRAMRRMHQNRSHEVGQIEHDKIIRDQKLRDKLDSQRALSPLTFTEDMVRIDTTDLTLEQTITTVLKQVRGGLSHE